MRQAASPGGVELMATLPPAVADTTRPHHVAPPPARHDGGPRVLGGGGKINVAITNPAFGAVGGRTAARHPGGDAPPGLTASERRGILLQSLDGLNVGATASATHAVSQHSAFDNKFRPRVFVAELFWHGLFYLLGPLFSAPFTLAVHRPAWVMRHGFLPPLLCCRRYANPGDRAGMMFSFFVVELPAHIMCLAMVLVFALEPRDSGGYAAMDCHFDVSLDVALPLLLLSARLLIVALKYAYMKPSERSPPATAGRRRCTGGAPVAEGAPPSVYFARTLLSAWSGPLYTDEYGKIFVDMSFDVASAGGAEGCPHSEPAARLIVERHSRNTVTVGGGPTRAVLKSVWSTATFGSNTSKAGRRSSLVAGGVLASDQCTVTVPYREIAAALLVAASGGTRASPPQRFARFGAECMLLGVPMLVLNKYGHGILPFNNAACTAQVPLGVLHVLTLQQTPFLANMLLSFGLMLVVDLQRRAFMLSRLDALIRRIQLRSPRDVTDWMRGRDIIQNLGAQQLQRMGQFLVIGLGTSVVALLGWIFTFLLFESVWLVRGTGTGRETEAVSSTTAAGVGAHANAHANATGGTVPASGGGRASSNGYSLVPRVFVPGVILALAMQCLLAIATRAGAIANRACFHQALHWSKILSELSHHEHSLSRTAARTVGGVAPVSGRGATTPTGGGGSSSPSGGLRARSAAKRAKGSGRGRPRSSSDALAPVAVGLPKTLAELRSVESSINAVIKQLEMHGILCEIRLASIPLSWTTFHRFAGVIFSEMFFLGTIALALAQASSTSP